MVRLLLVRHGETDWNAQKRYQGQTDVPLNARGLAQARLVGRRLAGESLQAVYSSDLARAYATAEVVAASHGLTVLPEPRLRELSFGAWEGLTYPEIEAREPELLAAWNGDPCQVAPPEGETVEGVRRRLSPFTDHLREAHTRDTVALVGHGGCFQVLLCMALGVALPKPWAFRLDSASLSVLDLYPEGGILSLLNDCHHLHGEHPWPSEA
ncbi:MAG: alpha-ribazole phosphatase [Anaerolineae bacterium]